MSPCKIPLRFDACLAALFVLVVLVAHGSSFRGEFVLDDAGSIVENASIHSLSALWKVLTEGEYTTVAGRPLLNLTLAINYAWGGTRPEGYHAVNYLLHAANAWLLSLLLRRALVRFPKTQAAAVPLAVAISLLWCIHPLTINAVSYVVQRAESIASGCYLAALLAFAKGVQTSRRRWFAISVLSAGLGGLAKETIATVPFAVIAFDALVLTGDWRTAWRRHWAVYLFLLSSWLPLGVCMWASNARASTVGFDMGVSLQKHVQTQVWALARYFRLAFWPEPLTFDYGDRFVVTDQNEIIAAFFVVAALGTWLMWLLVRKSPWAILGVLPVLLLGPTSVIPIATQPVAEHRMYLASAAVITAVVLWVFLALQRLPRFSTATLGWRAAAVGAVLMPAAVMLLLATVRHTRHFLSAEALWTDTVRKQPDNQRAVFSLAAAKFNARSDDALVESLCDQAIRLPGRYAVNAYELRGQIADRRGQYQQALDDFTQAIALAPNGKYAVVGAYEHRAQVYAQQQEFQKALDDFSQAIALRPRIVKYYLQRAITFRDCGRYDEAFRDLDKAEEIDPANINTDLVRASVDVTRGELTLALRSFDRLLAKDPNHLGARRRRIWVYTQLERWTDAMREIRLLEEEGQRVDSKLVQQVQQHLASRNP